MQTAPLTDHRLRRMLRWTSVWLAMALALLPARGGMGPFVGWMGPALETRVREMRRMVLHILFLLAFRAAPPRARRLTKPDHGQDGAKRDQALFDARLAVGHRLARRRRGVRAEIEALLALVRDPDAALAFLTRRIKRGAIRRMNRARAPTALLLALTPASAPIAANSS